MVNTMPMKRILFAILSIFAFSSIGAVAQYNESPCRAGWGIRANIDINIPGHFRLNGESVKMFKNGTGISLGAVYSIPVGPYFFFQPGAGLFYDTYRYDNIVIEGDSDQGRHTTVDPAVRKIGIRIPLHFGYTLDIWEKAAVAFYTGPQFDYSFYGRVSASDDIEWGEPYSEDLFGPYNQRRFDIAWKVGVGIPMNRWYVGLEAAFGLLDLMRTDFTFHENRVSLTLGYNF